MVEVLITMLLVFLLIIAGISSLVTMQQSSSRLADYTAASSLVRGRVEAILAATYNPPIGPFGASAVVLTNAVSIALNVNGTNYMVNGSIVSVIEPVASGHLVTVTGTFPTWGQPLIVTEQLLVNKFCGGQN